MIVNVVVVVCYLGFGLRGDGVDVCVSKQTRMMFGKAGAVVLQRVSNALCDEDWNRRSKKRAGYGPK